MIDEPPTVGQMLEGEVFILDGEKYEVLENRGMKYVLCKRRRDGDMVHLDQNYTIESVGL
jgi:Lhr-like helicase